MQSPLLSISYAYDRQQVIYIFDLPVAACVGDRCSPGCRLWCLWWCLFVLFFFRRGVLDEILNLIESVSEGFPSYFR